MLLKSISSPASLSSLPIELDRMIFLHLHPTQKHAITLSRVSRRFQAAAEPYIWRNLTISTSRGPGRGMSVKEQKEAIAKWLTKKLKGMKDAGMMDTADRRRWGLVRKATIQPTGGALHETIQILNNISPTLESLAFSTPRSDKHPEWIDVRLSTCGILLSFPSLRYVRIKRKTTHFVEFLIVLCDTAPSLTVLDIEICDASKQSSRRLESNSDSEDVSSSGSPYRFTRNTRIRRLRILYEETEDRSRLDPNPFDMVIGLIQYSPAIENLSVIFDRHRDFPVHRLGPIVARLANLAFLNWPVMELGTVQGDGTIELYPKLRRLALGHKRETLPIVASPPMPALETLVIDCSWSASWQRLSDNFYHDFVSIDIPMFASWVTRHPRLRNIHYLCKQLKGHHKTHVDFGVLHRCRGKPTGLIRTVTHLDETLLQISLQFWQNGNDSYGGLDAIMANDESDRLEIPSYRRVWKTFTGFEEAEVPSWVWNRMREAAGAREKDLDARGVEVDEATWKVLQDWRDAPKRS